MPFGSISFLYFFLPLTLGAVLAAPARWRNGLLLLASLFFYAWGAPRFVFALVASCALDYLLSILMARSPRRAALACAAGVCGNLALLGFFKLGSALPASAPTALRIVMPLGLSFVVFQKISYLVDVRRGAAECARGFGRYLLYIFLFPQLTLGPIIRYHDMAWQFGDRRVTTEDFLSGLWRVALGLGRKMLVATPLAAVADAAFAASASGAGVSCGSAWLGLYAYTLQLYFDFAGYCDIAVGVGRMLGFSFPENFDAPYISRDMAEFWRRWHITLGAFMKEYLYIPLGGNRCSKPRALFNNWFVFLVSGFWHGAAWNFIFWGAWHGFWIMAAKLVGRRGRGEAWTVGGATSAALTFLLVALGWVFFRAETFGEALKFTAALFGHAGTTAVGATPPFLAALVVGTFLSFAPAFVPRLGISDWRLADAAPDWKVWIRTAATAALIVAATLPLLTSGFAPFIYNRF